MKIVENSKNMDFKKQTIIIVPTRFASTRLPAKFKADIAGEPMLAHVLRRVIESGYKNIYLACDHEECAVIARNLGVKVIMTDVSHANGTDRVYEAVQNLVQSDIDFSYVVNVQGDMPFFDPVTIDNAVQLLVEGGDMSTLAVPLAIDEDFYNPNVVKVVLDNQNSALYFSRSPVPHNSTQYYRHVGIYGFTKSALERYISYPPSSLEIVERLEQLRALENGMKIRVALTKQIPISVDVVEDLEEARIYAQNIAVKNA